MILDQHMAAITDIVTDVLVSSVSKVKGRFSDDTHASAHVYVTSVRKFACLSTYYSVGERTHRETSINP